MAFIYDMVDTWNDAGTTFTAIKMNVTNTASAAASLLMDLQVGGSSLFNIRKDGTIFASNNGIHFENASYQFFSKGITNGMHALFFGIDSDAGNAAIGQGATFMLGSNGSVNWLNNTNLSASIDTSIFRDAANTVAQRRGTNAQTFRVYNTFTDASNYERFNIDWITSSNFLRLETTAAGTGTGRSIIIQSAGSLALNTNSGGAGWDISTTGHLTTGADNAYDIGASGATRPRDIYIAGKFTGQVMTIASLPSPASAGVGARLFVTNALAPAFAVSIASAGSVNCPVYSDGSTWRAG